MTDYHGKMMNIQGRPASMIVGGVSAWNDGHKHARHAAAKIANAADAEIAAQSARIDALESALEEIASRHVIQSPLWWQSLARTALNDKTPTDTGPAGE